MASHPTHPCPICQAAASPLFMAGEHRMYRCAACATAFVWPMPSDEQLAQFYARFHLSADAGGWYDDAESRMQADFPAKVALLRQFTGGDARVLDVGCGKGFFVKACRDGGIAAEGVDLSEAGVRYAIERLGVKATCGSLHDLKGSLGSFDAVTFWATIEHLPRPVEMLRDIHAVLKPGGHLLLDTGVGADWLDRLLPGRVQWYDPPQHLFVFSATGLRRALESTGFQVARFDPCFERSSLRRWVRIARGALVAGGLRAVAAAGRLRQGEIGFTRFPLGNLMLAIARKAP